MISIVICSKKDSLLAKISENIAETIGVDYELVIIKNDIQKLGICEAYNLGAAKSLHEILVFVHEDVLFLKDNWGQIIAKNIFDESVGMLGVAGSVIVTDLPVSWVEVPSKFYRSSDPVVARETKHLENNVSITKQISEVVILDGMFLCMRKDVWQLFPFDQKNFKYFNLYDLDISMAIGSRFKLFVANEILVDHSSLGNFSASWFEDSKRFVSKWKGSLPKCCIQIGKREDNMIKYHSTTMLIYHLMTFKESKIAMIAGVIRLFLLRPFSRMNLLVLTKIFKALL